MTTTDSSRGPLLSVVVAEPVASTRERLVRAVSGHGPPPVVVAAAVDNGQAAIDTVRQLQPALAILAPDLSRPDTLTVAQRLMGEVPTPLLVIAAPPIDPGVAERLIRAGVLDVIARPRDHATESEWSAFAATLQAHARLLADVRVVRHVGGVGGLIPAPRRRASPRSGVFRGDRLAGAIADRRLNAPRESGLRRPGGSLPTVPWRPTPRDAVRLAALVASTGGPPALAAVLRDMPPTGPIAFLVVQHIGARFVEGLVEWLDREIALPVQLAREGERPSPGVVYVAPSESHLRLRRGALHLQRADVRGAPPPSGDALLASLAAEAARHSVGVVLTGIGADGAEGLAALQLAGGWTIAQDEATSAVWGMPQAARGAACEILPLQRIGARLRELLA